MLIIYVNAFQKHAKEQYGYQESEVLREKIQQYEKWVN